jgi:midasin
VIEEVAARTGNDDFVVLHLDAQTDSKSLLGSYVVGATPGEFAWQPGALTQAVKHGRWVVIEDVDQAPFEVLAALVPLLEERRLYVPGRGESVAAADGFQLFGTVTTGAGRAGGGVAAASRADPLAGLWARVAVEPPSGDEPAAVLIGVHPRLAPLARRMLATLNVTQSECGQGGAAHLAPGGGAKGNDLDFDHVDATPGEVSIERTTETSRIATAPSDSSPSTGFRDARVRRAAVHASRPAPVGAAVRAPAQKRALFASRGCLHERKPASEAAFRRVRGSRGRALRDAPERPGAA